MYIYILNSDKPRNGTPVLTGIQNISYHQSNQYNLWYDIDSLTHHPPTRRPTDKQRLQINPCLRSSRLDSRGQRASSRRNFQAFCGHTGRQQEHPPGRHRFNQRTGVKQSSQPKLDSHATGWTIMTSGGMTRPCACS